MSVGQPVYATGINLLIDKRGVAEAGGLLNDGWMLLAQSISEPDDQSTTRYRVRSLPCAAGASRLKQPRHLTQLPLPLMPVPACG